jgi:hypothetical protein
LRYRGRTATWCRRAVCVADGKIAVVAAKNFYGDIARQAGDN